MKRIGRQQRPSTAADPQANANLSGQVLFHPSFLGAHLHLVGVVAIDWVIRNLSNNRCYSINYSYTWRPHTQLSLTSITLSLAFPSSPTPNTNNVKPYQSAYITTYERRIGNQLRHRSVP